MALPTQAHFLSAIQAAAGPAIECGVCAEDKPDSFFTPCAHSYCKSCAVKWFRLSDSCPVCRKSLYVRPAPRPAPPAPAMALAARASTPIGPVPDIDAILAYTHARHQTYVASKPPQTSVPAPNVYATPTQLSAQEQRNTGPAPPPTVVPLPRAVAFFAQNEAQEHHSVALAPSREPVPAPDICAILAQCGARGDHSVALAPPQDILPAPDIDAILANAGHTAPGSARPAAENADMMGEAQAFAWWLSR